MTEQNLKLFRERNEQGLKVRSVVHPQFGVIDTLFVIGNETPEQWAEFEKRVYEENGLTK